jgi:hypothetical protein
LIADRGHLHHAIELAQRCPLSRTAFSVGAVIIDAEGAALAKLTPDMPGWVTLPATVRLNRAAPALRDPAAALSSSPLPGGLKRSVHQLLPVAPSPEPLAGVLEEPLAGVLEEPLAGVLNPSFFGSPARFRYDLVEFRSGVTRQVGSLGRCCRSGPLVFSLLPRCHGECGSQKNAGKFVATVNAAWSTISMP